MGTGKRAPTILGVPMLKADEQPFSGKQIALLENFAAQAGDRDREHAPSQRAARIPAARYVFMSERGAPMSAVAFRRMLQRLVPAAKMMPFGIHPHMLRHSTGFKLANQGVDRGPCVPALCCRLVDGGC
jgi:site-specific recombinase XerD